MINPFPFQLLAENETLEESIVRAVDASLHEDIGTGDLTALLVPDTDGQAQVVIKQESAVLCGRAWFEACIKALDAQAIFDWQADEGETIHQGQCVCKISARTRALLSGERSSLNFLQLLSATATATRRMVNALAESPHPIEHGKRPPCVVLDTRKTIPGLRLAQKYAVRMGGGENQRLALWHGILIKENHIAAAGGIAEALNAAHAILSSLPRNETIHMQIEVESLEELQKALMAGAQSLLLDDFSWDDLRRAVLINEDFARVNRKAKALLEASGGDTY